MPLCHKIENEDFTLALWNLSESLRELETQFNNVALNIDIEQVNAFKYEGRKKEWIAVRLLIAELFGQYQKISYTDLGKPFIENKDINISISHTVGMVAVIVGKEMVSVDIERYSDRVLRIENKFMSEIEKSQIDANNKADYLLAYWSAKETLYKKHKTKGLDFKRNLYINSFELGDCGEFLGEVRTEELSSVHTLNYFNFDKDDSTYLVVYSCNQLDN